MHGLAMRNVVLSNSFIDRPPSSLVALGGRRLSMTLTLIPTSRRTSTRWWCSKARSCSSTRSRLNRAAAAERALAAFPFSLKGGEAPKGGGVVGKGESLFPFFLFCVAAWEPIL